MANSRPFADFLREQRSGVMHDELSDALQDLVAKVGDTDKAGSLTLTIKIKPENGVLMVSDDIKSTLPRPTKKASIFYQSPENNLVRQDPKQTSMQLEPLPGGKADSVTRIPAGVAKA